MSDKTILDARPSAGQRTIKFKNLTATQKSRLSAAMLGVGGISLGALTMALMGKASSASASGGFSDIHKADVKNVINRKTGEEEMEVPIFETAPFATSTSDDMSFGEAFGAARAEIGPGGFFEHRGKTYNTYYKEEWDALPPEEQKEFYASVDDSGIDKTDDRIDDDPIVIIEDKPQIEEEIIISEEEIIAILNDDEKGDDDIFIGGEEDIVITNDDDDYEEIVVIEDGGDFVVIDEDGGGEFVVIEDDNPFEEDNYDDDIAVVEDDIDISDLG